MHNILCFLFVPPQEKQRNSEFHDTFLPEFDTNPDGSKVPCGIPYRQNSVEALSDYLNCARIMQQTIFYHKKGPLACIISNRIVVKLHTTYLASRQYG
jgi:hypothetical protein